MKVFLQKGYAEVPDGATVVDLSTGNAVDAGVIIDRKRELPPVVLLSAKSTCGLSQKEEDRIVNEAVKELPQYLSVKTQELPYDDPMWEVSFRLGFFPIALLTHFPDSKYKLYKEG